MKSLRLRDIGKDFGLVSVLHDINMDVDEGEFIILVGPSGCGKSTLLNIVAGLETSTNGWVEIGGRDVTRVPSKDRDIAMVFQNYALYPNMTVKKNIVFGLEMRKVPKNERDEIAHRVSTMLAIEHLLDRKPGQLSGGQRQRVAMGRALARDPSLFLFDEPLSNLDAKLRVEMRGEIRRLHQRTRTTTLYVTHDQVEAMTMGDRIAVMKEGRVLQFDTPENVYSRPATRYVAEFIGTPAINIVDATRSDEGLVSESGQALPLTDEQRTRLSQSDSRAMSYAVRPEAVRFFQQDTVDSVSVTSYSRFHENRTSTLHCRDGRLAEGDARHRGLYPDFTGSGALRARGLAEREGGPVPRLGPCCPSEAVLGPRPFPAGGTPDGFDRRGVPGSVAGLPGQGAVVLS